MVSACLIRAAPRMEWMKSCSNSAALRSTMGCTALRESLRHCQISGERGRESGLSTRSLDRNENNRDKSQTAVFLRSNFSPRFSLRFSPHFSLRFSPHFFAALFATTFAPSLQTVAPWNFHSCHDKTSMSNEVAQYR